MYPVAMATKQLARRRRLAGQAPVHQQHVFDIQRRGHAPRSCTTGCQRLPPIVTGQNFAENQQRARAGSGRSRLAGRVSSVPAEADPLERHRSSSVTGNAAYATSRIQPVRRAGPRGAPLSSEGSTAHERNTPSDIRRASDFNAPSVSCCTLGFNASSVIRCIVSYSLLTRVWR